MVGLKTEQGIRQDLEVKEKKKNCYGIVTTNNIS